MDTALENLNFSFQASELTGKLRQASHDSLTGYWQILLHHPESTDSIWYLAVVEGKIVFSGSQRPTCESFAEILRRYVLQARKLEVKVALEGIRQELISPEQSMQLRRMLTRLEEMNLLNHADVVEALHLKLLADLDGYLFKFAGQAKFFPAAELADEAPIQGFDLNSLMLEAVKRRVEWDTVHKHLPSMDCILTLNLEALEKAGLPEGQKQQLKLLLKDGKPLSEIAYLMGKDALAVTKTFSQLIQKGLVAIKTCDNAAAITTAVQAAPPQPEIFIVDDSNLLLKQFQALVTKWGYQVKSSDNALIAVDAMLHSHPSAIFLDINMPGASGFELIKQIRRQAALASLPVVLLTAERTVSNQWRAQWANCKFLAKPRTPEEAATFRTELRDLLLEIAPIPTDHLV